MLAYKGIGLERGKIVPAEDALEYAMIQCGIQVTPGMELDENFAKFLEEWFFSGDWELQGEED